VLLGVASAGLAGCSIGTTAPRWEQGADPVEALRSTAADLVDRYTATIRRHPDLTARLTPLLDNHRAQLDALDRQLVRTGTPAPAGSASAAAADDVPGDVPGAFAALLAAEKAALPAITAACLSAPFYRAALLGSIAAAIATHIEVLS
jgi:hypothetical protein